jgi:hypothetical protein
MNGEFLPNSVPLAPQPYTEKASNDWGPFSDHCEFELADLLYTQIQMSGSNANKFLNIFAAYLHKHGSRPPFSSCAVLQTHINFPRFSPIFPDFLERLSHLAPIY